MRLWSLDLSLLDQKGLTALWRESLLAKHVLEGKTRGYKNHPQLNRFKSCQNPIVAINTYLMLICTEAKSRGYNFDFNKIDKNNVNFDIAIPVTSGQVTYEFRHLQQKLESRAPSIFTTNMTKDVGVNTMFYEIPGDVEKWEIIK